MDNAREEVRAKLVSFAAALGVERPQSVSNIDGFTDAIMSALKRGAGVVVSPLVWREHSGPAWVAATPFGQYAIGKLVGGGFTAQFSRSHFVGDFDTLEAAKAACQADFAKRITSAVEPAPVVITAEMARRLEPLLPPFSASPKELSEAITAVLSPRSEEERWAEVEAVIQARDGRKKREDEALTSALSSRTEEERESDMTKAIHKIAERADREGLTCADGRVRVGDWLRSLTNGEGNEMTEEEADAELKRMGLHPDNAWGYRRPEED